jgi:hypothetical protein
MVWLFYLRTRFRTAADLADLAGGRARAAGDWEFGLPVPSNIPGGA